MFLYLGECRCLGIEFQKCKWKPGPRLNIKSTFPKFEDPMLKIRRSRYRLIFNMGIHILARRHLYTETALWLKRAPQTLTCRILSYLHILICMCNSCSWTSMLTNIFDTFPFLDQVPGFYSKPLLAVFFSANIEQISIVYHPLHKCVTGSCDT